MITGDFRRGATPADAVRVLNSQGKVFITDFQSELTKRCRALSKQIQDDINNSVEGGSVAFTKRAIFFNFIQHGNGTRTNQIIVRGSQAAYLRSVLTDDPATFNKIIPTANARMTAQGNIAGLHTQMGKKYKVVEQNGKKYLIDTSLKKKKRSKRIIGKYEKKRRKMIYDFFSETEHQARLIINNMKGTFIFRRN
ncbi:hypothetical protein [Leclercia sp. 119287]|uniref:hypothetical protein n=1 Tax=Leclercia sp. 119287 TaxID=2681308 RepID=UPI0018CE7177|nr:hypothetical protein [Leclercia sp. 119287]